ncbi:HU family DNA-binding protein [Salinihabitans flavidus]|uniref:HU family DNA-binding protein n=1 Tax=Salinihabitans flavidus TaxID=569882 RepID=UPI001FE0F7EC|nr:HU family DNA-binding protein [Salinihabitans flavidus]
MRASSTAKTAPAPEPVVVRDQAPEVSAPELKNPELVEMVVERSGIKKRDAKPAIEAALAILGAALAEGRDLNLRDFGKMKVTNTKEKSNGMVMTARVRQPLKKPVESGQEPLAEPAE